MPDTSLVSHRVVLAIGLLLATTVGPGFAQPWWDFRIEVDPPNPRDSTPVTVTVALEFGDTCYEVCDVTGEWVGPSLFHIDWYIRDSHPGGCLRVVTTRSSEIPLGLLDPSDYHVTATAYMTFQDASCMDGTFFDQAETTFGVDSGIPTVSDWGLIVMAVLLLSTGIVVLRRRVRTNPE